METNAIKIFEEKKVRTVWDEEQEKWYISVIDVIEILTNTDRPRKYWSDLKAKLKKKGSELSAKIGQLKMTADDGKRRMTDVADTDDRALEEYLQLGYSENWINQRLKSIEIYTRGDSF